MVLQQASNTLAGQDEGKRPSPTNFYGERDNLEGKTTRTYKGHIVSGTGLYAKANGSMTITIILNQIRRASDYPYEAETEYAVSVTLRGATCQKHPHTHKRDGCLTTSGTIKGTGAGERQMIPDTASKIALTSASGKISPLGNVSAHGELVGTGYVASGTRRMWMILATKSGTVSIGGEGPRVGGFTAP
jgi:hypothetical protein